MTVAARYAGWVWPVEVHRDGRRPVVSDGFGREKRSGRGHLGADVMYRRAVSGEVRGHDFSRHFEMKSGEARALACGPGTVFKVAHDSHGGIVMIDHHAVPGVGPRVSVYRHLTRASVVKGEAVAAGHEVGRCGFDPTGGPTSPTHLHFELWDTSRPDDGREGRDRFAVDPAELLDVAGFRGSDGGFHRGGGGGGGGGLVASAGESGEGLDGGTVGADLAHLAGFDFGLV